MADRKLDCTKLRCPMPIVKISREMNNMEIGQTLAVEATDFAFKADIEAWTKKMGQEILEFLDGPIKCVVIRKLK